MKSKKHSVKTPLAQFVAIIALSISIFLVVDLGRRAAANYQVQREAERLGQEVDLARQQQEALRARLEHVRSDIFVDEIARSELKWTLPGETVFVVMPIVDTIPMHPGRKAQHNAVIPTAQTPAQAWWVLFFGTEVYPRYIRETP